MASKVDITAYCDICLSHGTYVEATYSEVIQIGRLRRSLDLCATHREAVLDPVRAALEEFGHVPPEKAPRPAEGR